MKLTKKSPAKINIFLQVLSKRDDGFHELNTLMVPVTLFDNIIITISDGYGVKCTLSEGGVYSDVDIPMNIVVKAANIYLSKARPTHDITDYFVDIEIEKNIPIGAGLGGGSSNAATVLLMLEEMLKVGFSKDELMEMAGELGSDVPFFIPCKPAIATGRGEILSSVEYPESHFILINPVLNISTADVYGNLDLTKKGENNILSYSGVSSNPLNATKELLINDLEPLVIEKHSIIGELKDALIEEGALGSLMSGSGSTVFGVFENIKDRDKAYDRLKIKYKDLKVFSVDSIT